jgi:hypothetical protein
MMHLKKQLLTVFFILVIFAHVGARPLASDKMKPEELVAKHLAAIGPADALASIKSIIVVGDARAISRSNAVRDVVGVAQLASEGEKVLFAMVFNSVSYPFEKAAYDGQKVTVALWTTGQRSDLEEFLLSQDTIFRQGLFGGVLSSAWPLLNVEKNGLKLSYSGTKKLDERLVHEIKCAPRKGAGDLRISLFFDAETFRHVRTDYSYTVSARMGSRPGDSVQGATTDTGSATINHYKLTEEFSDFQTTEKLTLPHAYKLRLSIDAQRTQSLEWAVTFKQFAFNQQIGAGAFTVSASK